MERDVADQIRPKARRAKFRSTIPIEHLNGEIKRRTEGAGILPNGKAIVLVGALVLGWAMSEPFSEPSL